MTANILKDAVADGTLKREAECYWSAEAAADLWISPEALADLRSWTCSEETAKKFHTGELQLEHDLKNIIEHSARAYASLNVLVKAIDEARSNAAKLNGPFTWPVPADTADKWRAVFGSLDLKSRLTAVLEHMTGINDHFVPRKDDFLGQAS